LVRGSSIAGAAGKRADAVLRTAGALSAIVLVEIKHPGSQLLGKEYRSDCWSIGNEVAGGVAQCQATAAWAKENLTPSLKIRDAEGFNVDSVQVCRPRSILVAGSLEQFKRNGNLNRPMYESFERFHRSVRDPEIVTFDEMYERASAVRGPTGASTRSSSPSSWKATSQRTQAVSSSMAVCSAVGTSKLAMRRRGSRCSTARMGSRCTASTRMRSTPTMTETGRYGRSKAAAPSRTTGS
jgi:hypothetical protein